ncbi:hypothetical protein DW091_02335 [Eubacterium sp. AM05-23]|uniref:hypothetical protein n=1 Tax=Eubacterium TaxID=1730 RepID=UPI000E4740A8|nr:MULTISPECIES: hypothetical protein [Eubacterium]RHO60326.1 hypothetical protein DW091_02335 [Eubacterium sp. AM05-23]
MEAKLLGYLPMDFETKEGNHIEGVKLFIVYNDDAENLQGARTADIFVSHKIAKDYNFKEYLNKFVFIYFNNKGKFYAMDKIDVDADKKA